MPWITHHNILKITPDFLTNPLLHDFQLTHLSLLLSPLHTPWLLRAGSFV